MVAPEGSPPLILVTTDRRELTGLKDSPRIRPYRPEVWIGEAYVRAVQQAGGIALLVPPGTVHLQALLHVAHGVVLTGGHFDIHPRHYGQSVSARLDRVEEDRTSVELTLARLALEQHIPLLGVCGGMQAMAVAAGGTLVQDVPKDALDHEQPNDPAEPSHAVAMSGPALQVFEPTEQVNSTHHQAVDAPGRGLVVCGRAPDGTTEVIASPEHFALGVQWHPELLGDLRPYEALVRAANARLG